jgi:hypothetical protein
VEQGQRQSESHIPKKLAIANDHQMAKELWDWIKPRKTGSPPRAGRIGMTRGMNR